MKWNLIDEADNGCQLWVADLCDKSFLVISFLIKGNPDDELWEVSLNTNSDTFILADHFKGSLEYTQNYCRGVAREILDNANKNFRIPE